MTHAEPEAARAAYLRIVAMRNKRWDQRDQYPEGSERWWFYQGQAEALADAMTILEQDCGL